VVVDEADAAQCSIPCGLNIAKNQIIIFKCIAFDLNKQLTTLAKFKFTMWGYG
jgi:hypothetical protein